MKRVVLNDYLFREIRPGPDDFPPLIPEQEMNDWDQ